MIGQGWNLFLNHLTQVRATSLCRCKSGMPPSPPSYVCSIPFFLVICNDVGLGQKGSLKFLSLCFVSQWDNPFSMADNGNKQQFEWCGFALLLSFFFCKVVAICNRVAVNIKCSESWTIKNTLYLSHNFWLWNCPWQVAMSIPLVL